MLISTKCKELLDDMEGVELLDDGRISKKDQMRTHASDAASYMAVQRWGNPGGVWSEEHI